MRSRLGGLAAVLGACALSLGIGCDKKNGSDVKYSPAESAVVAKCPVVKGQDVSYVVGRRRDSFDMLDGRYDAMFDMKDITFSGGSEVFTTVGFSYDFNKVNETAINPTNTHLYVAFSGPVESVRPTRVSRRAVEKDGKVSLDYSGMSDSFAIKLDGAIKREVLDIVAKNQVYGKYFNPKISQVYLVANEYGVPRLFRETKHFAHSEFVGVSFDGDLSRGDEVTASGLFVAAVGDFETIDSKTGKTARKIVSGTGQYSASAVPETFGDWQIYSSVDRSSIRNEDVFRFFPSGRLEVHRPGEGMQSWTIETFYDKVRREIVYSDLAGEKDMPFFKVEGSDGNTRLTYVSGGKKFPLRKIK